MRVRRSSVAVSLVSAALAGLAPSAAAATATISPSNVGVALHHVAGGFSNPVSVTSARDGSRRLFVVEQGGTVRVFHKGSVQSAAYLDVSSEVVAGGEQGLLSVAFHPGFRRHPFVFAAYTRASDGALQVSRFKASSPGATRVALSTERRLFAVPHPGQTNHNGGQLMFSAGGLLYVTTGDGGGGGDPYRNAEDLTSLSGKVLRVDADHWCGTRHYCIPKTNPFAGAKNANKRLVFHWGLRNPWRASVDRADGTLWIGDVGQDAYEEVDHVGKAGGRDFGWSCMEGPVRYPGGASCTGRHLTGPVRYYDHSNSRCAVIGGYAYHGPTYPFAHGLYLSADYCSGEIWAIGRTSAGGYPRAKVADVGAALTGFGEADGGEIYAVSQGGGLYHVAFRRR